MFCSLTPHTDPVREALLLLPGSKQGVRLRRVKQLDPGHTAYKWMSRLTPEPSLSSLDAALEARDWKDQAQERLHQQVSGFKCKKAGLR